MRKSSKKSIGVQRRLMEKVLNDPRYKGKHIVIVGNKIFTTNTGEGAGQVLKRVRKEYPTLTPAVTYIPDADTLILWL